MGRRRRDDNPISLFSFQDIVTSVTGILILLSLILAISVITQGTHGAAQSEYVPAGDLRKSKEELNRQIAELDRQIIANEATIVGWIGASVEELSQKRSSYEVQAKQLLREAEEISGKVKAESEDVKKAKSDPATSEVEREIEETAKQITAATQDLEELRSGSRVFYNFRSGSRKAWIVQISGAQILAARANEKSKPQVFRESSELVSFAKSLPDAEKYLILVVRPTGLQSFRDVREQLEDSDVDLGVELIGESQIVVDPETGAGEK